MAEADVVAALTAPDPAAALDALVRARLASGQLREELLAELEQVRVELQDEDREADEDLVLDAMDLVVGWVAPHRRLPDE